MNYVKFYLAFNSPNLDPGVTSLRLNLMVIDK